jgi:hypothetical protein
MSKKRSPREGASCALPLSPELEAIFKDLESPDPGTRAAAVRQLCPCRGTPWEVPVFTRVLEMRNDPSPIVQHAVTHDLRENPDWGQREELRRLEGRRLRQEQRRVKEDIEAATPGDESPSTHSLAWRAPRRPRVRKAYYPRGRR